MTLSKSLIADYVELINNDLDNITVNEPGDFQLVQAMLANILNPALGHHVPVAYHETMQSIQVYFQSPELYVAEEEDFDHFRQLIRERCHAKIREFSEYTPTQQQCYIEFQRNKKTLSSQNQERMRQCKPPLPDSEAHSLSETEWHAELQSMINRTFSQSPSPPPPPPTTARGELAPWQTDDSPFSDLIMERIDEQLPMPMDELPDSYTLRDLRTHMDRLDRGGYATEEIVATLSDTISDYEAAIALSGGLFSMSDLLDIPTYRISTILLNENCIHAIQQGEITLERIKDMTNEEFSDLSQQYNETRFLV